MTTKIFNMTNQMRIEQEQVARVSMCKREEAAKFLESHFSDEDKNFLRALYKDAGDPHWFSGYHFRGGMVIRNALRENGYGEDYFGIDNLDYIYCSLMEMAIGVYDGGDQDILKVRRIRV